MSKRQLVNRTADGLHKAAELVGYIFPVHLCKG